MSARDEMKNLKDQLARKGMIADIEAIKRRHPSVTTGDLTSMATKDLKQLRARLIKSEASGQL